MAELSFSAAATKPPLIALAPQTRKIAHCGTLIPAQPDPYSFLQKPLRTALLSGRVPKENDVPFSIVITPSEADGINGAHQMLYSTLCRSNGNPFIAKHGATATVLTQAIKYTQEMHFIRDVPRQRWHKARIKGRNNLPNIKEQTCHSTSKNGNKFPPCNYKVLRTENHIRNIKKAAYIKYAAILPRSEIRLQHPLMLNSKYVRIQIRHPLLAILRHLQITHRITNISIHHIPEKPSIAFAHIIWISQLPNKIMNRKPTVIL
jgi:hypothetical protein